MRVLQDHNETNQLRALAAQTLGVIGNKSHIDKMRQVAEEWQPGNETVYNVRAIVEKAVSFLILKD